MRKETQVYTIKGADGKEKKYTVKKGELVEVHDEPIDKKVLTPDEGRALLGLSRNTFMSLLYSGRIRAVKAGRRWLVPAEALDEFLGENR
ncbi:MAG: Helix-turn-helix domain [Firmicutes bacterium]|nr:Helix-turn-helix domain [Bacillota bacterium]